MERGTVVVSLSGKDAGCLLAVVEVTSLGIYVSDGKHRPLQHPKRKNPRHLRELEIEIGEESMATNRMLRRVLREIPAQDRS